MAISESHGVCKFLLLHAIRCNIPYPVLRLFEGFLSFLRPWLRKEIEKDRDCVPDCFVLAVLRIPRGLVDWLPGIQ